MDDVGSVLRDHRTDGTHLGPFARREFEEGHPELHAGGELRVGNAEAGNYGAHFRRLRLEVRLDRRRDTRAERLGKVQDGPLPGNGSGRVVRACHMFFIDRSMPFLTGFGR